MVCMAFMCWECHECHPYEHKHPGVAAVRVPIAMDRQRFEQIRRMCAAEENVLAAVDVSDSRYGHRAQLTRAIRDLLKEVDTHLILEQR